MEREQITREDFEIVGDGWDPDEVRAHLAAVADAVAGGAGDETDPERSLGDLAAGRVRGVLEAAEQAAAEIKTTSDADAAERVTAARAEAERILADARAESASLLRRARSDADSHVAAAREAVEDLVGQAEALLAQVTALGDRVSAAAPASAGPVAVSATTVGPAAEVPGGPAIVPEPAPPQTPDPGPEPTPDPGPEPTPDPVPEPEPEPTTEQELAAEPAPAPADEPAPEPELETTRTEATTTEELIAQLRAASSDDANGSTTAPASAVDPESDPGAPAAVSGSDLGAARLVAMNMALEGATREQIASQLRSEFGPVDGVEDLLDDVLARAGR